MSKELIMNLFESWKGPGRLDRSLFARDFNYYGGSDVHTTEVWINADNGDEGISDAEILKLELSGDEGEIIFRFKDPVTLLVHTTKWVVKTSNGRIKEIIETEQ